MASAATPKVRMGDVSQCFGYGRLYLLRDGGAVVILISVTRFFAGRFARVIWVIPLSLIENLLFGGLYELSYFSFGEF